MFGAGGLAVFNEGADGSCGSGGEFGDGLLPGDAGGGSLRLMDGEDCDVVSGGQFGERIHEGAGIGFVGGLELAEEGGDGIDDQEAAVARVANDEVEVVDCGLEAGSP